MEARKLFAIGAGVGLEVRGQDLAAVLVRVRPGGVKVLDLLTIPQFRERPAAEWGAEYQAFLKRRGMSHLAATFLLPRHEVIVRQLSLPGVSPREMGAAVELQIDGLHPYGDDEIRFSWSRLPGAPAVLVAIARKSLIDEYSQLFLEAGVKVAAFSFSAAALYSGVRMLAAPPSSGFLAAGGEEKIEIYGESPERPLFSAVVEMAPERALALAASELRLPPETQALPLAEVLPKPLAAPEGFDPARWAATYAAALTSACPWLSLKTNLLPPELRSSSSRMILAPTLALVGILAALAVALAAQPEWERRRQLSLLQEEIAKLEPQVQRVETLKKAIEREQERILLLDAFRRRTGEDLEALQTLTKALEPPAWLSSLEMDRQNAVLTGEIDQAAPLLKLLDSTPYFKDSEFAGPVGRSGKKETFRIRAAREGVQP